MLRKLLLTGIVVLSTCLYAFAQSGSITGTITDASSGEPILGVNVFISSVSRGAATDTNGKFTIDDLDAGTYSLRITYVGYQSLTRKVEVTSGATTINIKLKPALINLNDIVVTAQGIQRKKRALGYSVSNVSTKELENKGEADITRTLKGKVPGVKITQTSGVLGTATDFVIRGYSTISGSNQPLYIVDGVQFNTSTNSGSDFVTGGSLSTSSRSLDLDPDNIKSINVLKGLSATTIYGAQGRNGVVLITTKSGSFNQDQKPGFDVTINQSVYANQIASLPDYQNNYGGGFEQALGFFFSNWGPNFNSDLSDNSLFIRKAADGTNILKSPYSQISSAKIRAAFPEYQKGGEHYEYPYKAYSTPAEFFRTGLEDKTSLNISGGLKGINVNLNVGRSNATGFTPGNKLVKNNVGLGADFKISDKLTVNSTANVALTDQKTPPIAYSNGSSASDDGNGSVFGDIFYTPRSIDVNHLPFENPVDGSSVYYRSGNDIQNPYWTVKNTKYMDDVTRLYGKAQANYKFTEGIDLTYKVGFDTYNESHDFEANKGGVNTNVLGYYQTRRIQNTVWDHNIYLNFDKDLTQDINLTGLLGGQYVLKTYNRQTANSRQQIIFNLFRHDNFISASDDDYESRQETAGAYATATLGYKDYVYLNLSGRNDWFSTLEVDNRSIFYPSASISFIPTDALDFGGDILNYMKVRAGVGTSAGAPGPYNTRSVLISNARSFVDAKGSVVTTNAISNQLGNRNLKAEKQIEYELGVDTQFFNNRLGLNITVYRKFTNNLITSAQLDPSTGYTNTTVNVGKLRNQGLELGLKTTPIAGKFQWNSNWNFSTYESLVQSLGSSLTSIAIHGFTDLGNFAEVGQPLNIIKGSMIERDDQGHRLVDAAGDYIEANDIGIIGNPNPKFTLSSINTFSYNNFSLTAQIDYRDGGDMYSTTTRTLLARGISSDTGFDRQVPLILPGYKQDGTPNDIQTTATDAYFNDIGLGPSEVSVYDGTTIRLSEVSLSYNLPVSILSKTPIKQISVTLSGFNLWYFTPFIPEGSNVDTNASGTGADNGLGFEFLTSPSARRFGGNISIKF